MVNNAARIADCLFRGYIWKQQSYRHLGAIHRDRSYRASDIDVGLGAHSWVTTPAAFTTAKSAQLAIVRQKSLGLYISF